MKNTPNLLQIQHVTRRLVPSFLCEKYGVSLSLCVSQDHSAARWMIYLLSGGSTAKDKCSTLLTVINFPPVLRWFIRRLAGIKASPGALTQSGGNWKPVSSGASQTIFFFYVKLKTKECSCQAGCFGSGLKLQRSRHCESGRLQMFSGRYHHVPNTMPALRSLFFPPGKIYMR